MHALPPLERKFWICACVVVAMAISSWTSYAWFGSGDIAGKTVVTLAADGSAEKRQEIVHGYTGYYRPRGFPLYTPKDWDVRLLDPKGHEMPIETSVTGTQARHEVNFTDSVFEEGRLHYTEVYGIPRAATSEDGVWTYVDGLRHKGGDREYSIAIRLPVGAELVSTEPTAEVETTDGRTQVRFQGTTLDDVQYTFTVRYKLPSSSKQEE